MMVTALFASALLFYVGASGTLALSFAGGRMAAPRAAVLLAGTGVVLHAVALATFTAAHSELPLVGLAPSLSTLAFLIALFVAAVSVTQESRPVALVLVPLVAVLLGVALLLGIAPTDQPMAFRGLWFQFHVLLAFAGYAGLTLAFGASLLYLLQFRELKDKHLGRVFRFFPALPVLDTLARRGIQVGFPALTLALLLGWAWTVRFRQTLAIADPQVIWGVLTWFVFAAVFMVRARHGAGAERKAAAVTVAGFVVVVISYLLLRLLFAGDAVFL